MATPNLFPGQPDSVTKAYPKVLVATTMADTADDIVYTVPPAHTTRLLSGSLSNTSGAIVNCGLSITPAGGTEHRIVPDNAPLGSNDAQPLADFIGQMMLGDGDVIRVHASVAGAVDVIISGVEMS